MHHNKFIYDWQRLLFQYRQLSTQVYLPSLLDPYVKITIMSVSRSVTSDSLQPQGLEPTRFICPRDSPGKNTGVSCHSLLQGIFPTQRFNPGLLHCLQAGSLPSELRGSPPNYEGVNKYSNKEQEEVPQQ